jgi:hypothetical protein
MKRKLPARLGAAEPPIPIEVRSDDEPDRVDFHFPVEIHMERREAPVDLDAIAEHVFDRLARRLT